jgi:NADPH-dependent 2,4-dienoyl-CoA reductase/sulfur reductase-like enzyme
MDSGLGKTMAMQDFELIIVGGGLTSARAIRAYRESGGAGKVLLTSKDSVLPYHRPPLSKRYLRGEAEARDAFVEPEAFYAESDVDVLLGTTVARIDSRAREVELENGTRHRFGKLLLASGARPRRLDSPGADLAGVYSLRSLEDATAIRNAAAEAREAVVIGGGFIGMEVAASLRHIGLEVTLVNRASGLFQALAAPELESEVAVFFADNDVNLVLSDEVAAFRGRSRVDSIETKTGKRIATDFVVAGVGVEPVVDFLEGSRLETKNGVLVNEHFETSVPGIFAAGDVANFYDPLYGRRRRIEHWSNANYQGAEVGRKLAGASGSYDTVSTFFTEIFGLTIKVFGDLGSHDELVVRGSLNDRNLLGFYLEQGRLVATLLAGQTSETEDELKRLIAEQALVDADILGDQSLDVPALLAATNDRT